MREDVASRDLLKYLKSEERTWQQCKALTIDSITAATLNVSLYPGDILSHELERC